MERLKELFDLIEKEKPIITMDTAEYVVSISNSDDKSQKKLINKLLPNLVRYIEIDFSNFKDHKMDKYEEHKALAVSLIDKYKNKKVQSTNEDFISAVNCYHYFNEIAKLNSKLPLIISKLENSEFIDIKDISNIDHNQVSFMLLNKVKEILGENKVIHSSFNNFKNTALALIEKYKAKKEVDYGDLLSLFNIYNLLALREKDINSFVVKVKEMNTDFFEKKQKAGNILDFIKYRNSKK